MPARPTEWMVERTDVVACIKHPVSPAVPSGHPDGERMP